MRVCMLTAAIGVALASATASPAIAQPARCLTDAEVEKVLDEQVKSAALLDTSRLPDLPMCSGLTVWQHAQHMRKVEVERLRIVGSAEELARAEEAYRGGEAAEAAAMAALEASRSPQPLSDWPPDMPRDGVQPPPVRLEPDK